MFKSKFCLVTVFFLAATSFAAPQITLSNTSTHILTATPITLGHPFAPGEIPKGKAIGLGPVTGGTVQMQSDVKAYYPDGSVKHAVLTFIVAGLAAQGQIALPLIPVTPVTTATAPLDIKDWLKDAAATQIKVTLGSQDYTGSIATALTGTTLNHWLSGPLCGEWIVDVPLKNTAGDIHPHLFARVGLRTYVGFKQARLDVTVENDWAFEPAPAGFTYDVSITSGTQVLYSKTGLAHTHHARWRKVAWIGEVPPLDWSPDVAYWIATGMFPYYDLSVKAAAKTLSGLATDFEPMANGELTSYMPQTGAHNDIGPLPHFAALFLISGNSQARNSVIANGQCGGSYHIHYRDKTKGLPVALDDYPYMTLLGNPPDAMNPKTGKSEAFPAVTGGLAKHDPDDAHQPSIGFLPYVVTGDYFFLEELQFWANYNMILANPGYRLQATGLLKWGQVRAQAWSMRTLGHAAFITPDDHPLKKYFNDKVANNIDWYTKEYANNAAANKLGMIGPITTATGRPWMDDFFTWTISYLMQLGWDNAQPLLKYKSQYVLGRMSAPFCWLHAGFYEDIRTTSDGSPLTTWATYAAANGADGACTGTLMTTYATDPAGYPANFQPALAGITGWEIPGAKEAWALYQTRNPKQDYSAAPQFAVVPKSQALGTFINPQTGYLRTPAPRGALHLALGEAWVYQLAHDAVVQVELFDAMGKVTLSKNLGKQGSGSHRLVLDSTLDQRLANLQSVFWVRMISEGHGLIPMVRASSLRGIEPGKE
jgi:hypothetical protein